MSITNQDVGLGPIVANLNKRDREVLRLMGVI